MNRYHKLVLKVMRWVCITDIILGLSILVLPSDMNVLERIVLCLMASGGGTLLLWVNKQLMKAVE